MTAFIQLLIEVIQKYIAQHRRKRAALRHSHCSLIQPPVYDNTGAKGFTHICNLTAGKDHRTYDLSQAILNEEIEHESWFSEFLGEGPSGHFLRRGETSPFVSKFLR